MSLTNLPEDGLAFDPADDATRPGVMEEAKVKRALRALQHVPTRRWVYLQIARRARTWRRGAAIDHALTGEEFRLLFALVEYADSDLSNCFPSVDTLAAGEGKLRRQVERVLQSLATKGWIRPKHCTGSSSGRQFLVPEGALAPWADGWEGPCRFQRRNL